jgi:hypothetical protein
MRNPSRTFVRRFRRRPPASLPLLAMLLAVPAVSAANVTMGFEHFPGAWPQHGILGRGLPPPVAPPPGLRVLP